MTSCSTPLDPACNPVSPKAITFDEVRQSLERIRNHVVRTPCIRSDALSDVFHCNVYLKLEFMQKTGSFKERGARNALEKLKGSAGVVCASAGNHGQGMAYHGKQLGCPVTVVMPTKAPIMKVQSCRKLKANVILHGEHVGESKTFALKLAKEKGMAYINGYDHPDVLAGQGTIGMELIEQVPDVDMVVVPVGGGGLITGISVAVKSLKPKTTIVGVEPENCTSFAPSLKAGRAITVESSATLADGLYVPHPGCNSVASSLGKVDHMVSVTEEFIVLAIFRLVESEKMIVEGAGATGVAALLSGFLPDIQGKKIVFIMSGRNIDTTVLCETLSRGLTMSNRLVRFTMTVSDRKKDIERMKELVKSMGLIPRHTHYEEIAIEKAVVKQVALLVETATVFHTNEIDDRLRQFFPDVVREEF